MAKCTTARKMAELLTKAQTANTLLENLYDESISQFGRDSEATHAIESALDEIACVMCALLSSYPKDGPIRFS